MTTEEARGASKALRRVNRVVSEQFLRRSPLNSRYPSDDVDEVLDDLDQDIYDRLIRMYEKGLRKGIEKATDWMLDGVIEHQKGRLVQQRPFTAKVRLTIRGHAARSYTFNIDPKIVGFDE